MPLAASVAAAQMEVQEPTGREVKLVVGELGVRRRVGWGESVCQEGVGRYA